MDFTQVGSTMGDESTPYVVTKYKAKTVREFIDEVLVERKDEWGYIAVKKKGCGFITSPKCEYRYGKLLSNLSEEKLDATIEHIESCGGWTRMDYIVFPNVSFD